MEVKHALSILSMLWACCSLLHADAIYNYAGLPFTYFQTQTACDGEGNCQTGNLSNPPTSLTITLDLANPLGPGVNTINSTTGTDVLSWSVSVSDGRTSLSSANSDVDAILGQLYMSPEGIITSSLDLAEFWPGILSLSLTPSELLNTSNLVLLMEADGSDFVNYYPIGLMNPEPIFTASTNGAGVWTAATPEPSYMIVCGLGLLALVFKARKFVAN